MYLIYSCVFFQKRYINLINLLLKSYILYGGNNLNIDYLIICDPIFKNKINTIFKNLNINGKIWCLNLNTKFEACCSRLKIFEYVNINNYSKILYLDCDILITNELSNILKFPLEDNIYALQEGNTDHHFWGKQLFNPNPNIPAFTSGILLFNNCLTIKNLFVDILNHINTELKKLNYKPLFKQNIEVDFNKLFGDQPFIVYHSITKNLYNNTKLINIVVNNPSKFNGETISHFPGGPGNYESKISKMTDYLNNVMFNQQYVYKTNNLHDRKFTWKKSQIKFLENGKMKAFRKSTYKFIDKYLVLVNFGNIEYLLKFNNDYSNFISIKKGNFEIVKGKLL